MPLHRAVVCAVVKVPAAHVSFLRRILPTSLFAHLVGTRYIGENVSLMFFDASFRKVCASGCAHEKNHLASLSFFISYIFLIRLIL